MHTLRDCIIPHSLLFWDHKVSSQVLYLCKKYQCNIKTTYTFTMSGINSGLHLNKVHYHILTTISKNDKCITYA